jgi:uncharacterized glyoxalase superfamily protein PhnB
MTPSVKPVPDGYHSIIPSLVCVNASEAIDFYKKVFGATERVRVPGPGGKIMHAELLIRDTVVFVNDPMDANAFAGPEPKSRPTQLFVYVEDADTVFGRALAAGARTSMALGDMFWGDRFGKFVDPFGHEWGVATHIEDVSAEEMPKRQQAFFAKAAGRQ